MWPFLLFFSDLNTALKDRQGDDATVLLATDNFFEVLAARVPGPDIRDQSGGPAIGAHAKAVSDLGSATYRAVTQRDGVLRGWVLAEAILA